jgi:hypothetical protein
MPPDRRILVVILWLEVLFPHSIFFPLPKEWLMP